MRVLALSFCFAVAGITAIRPGRILFISRLEILDQSIGATDGRSQILGVPGYLVETEVSISVRTDHVWLDVIFAVETPTGVSQIARIRRCVRYLSPGIPFRSEAVGKFVVYEVLQERQRSGIACVRVETFDEAFQHCSQVAC